MTDTDQDATTGSISLNGTQRWLSGIAGVLATGGGVVAIFVKDNNAGAAVLLIIGLVFLLMAITARAITSVKLPGGGQVDLEARSAAKRANAKADEAKGAAESATRQADYAIVTSAPQHRGVGTTFFEENIDVNQRPVPGVDRIPLVETNASSEMAHLVDQYEEIRSEFKSGHSRTQLMTQVVANMGQVSFRLHDFDWRSALRSNRQGERLSGYAYLFNRPHEDGAVAITDALLREDKPFGEYWALLALQKCLTTASSETIKEVTPRLRRLEYPPGTDRSYELMQTLQQIEALAS
jgi:hypothetical protein